MVKLYIIPGFLTLEITRVYTCGKSGCKGLNAEELKNAKAHVVLIEQTEECLKEGGEDVKEVDELPWAYVAIHPRYAEKMSEVMAKTKLLAPPNGRAVWLLKDKCGCPFAKFQACSSATDASTEEKRVMSGEAAVCSICQNKYTNNSDIRRLKSCYHFFHKECIENCIKTDPLCPLCYSWDDYVMVASDDAVDMASIDDTVLAQLP